MKNIFLSPVLLFILLNCGGSSETSGTARQKPVPAAVIPPGICRIEGTVTDIKLGTSLGTIASVTIDKVVGYGAAFTDPVAESSVITVSVPSYVLKKIKKEARFTGDLRTVEKRAGVVSVKYILVNYILLKQEDK